MGLYRQPRSPFWWMTLEGHQRRRESTGIRHDAASPALRKQLREDAEAVYHARMVQLARTKVGLPAVCTEGFLAFSEWYETHHTAKHRGAARERVILATLRAHFGQLLLSEIRPARWKEYETVRRKAGVSANTVGRELAVMKALLNTAVGEHLEVNPLAHVHRRTTRLPAKRTLTAADDRRLLKELRDPEIRDLYVLGVGSLLRQQNLVHLQRKHVTGTRIVLETKTGPHQLSLAGPTPLQRRAAAVLARRRPPTHQGYFFPRWHALFAKDRDSANAFFLKLVRRACRRAAIPWGLQNQGVVWHTLTRASGATRMLREYGVDVRTVQLLGGWRSLNQMAEYLGVDLAQNGAARRMHRV